MGHHGLYAGFDGSVLTGHFGQSPRNNLSLQLLRNIPPRTLAALSDPQALLTGNPHAVTAAFAHVPHGQILAVQLVDAIKLTLAQSLHDVFVCGLVVVVVAFGAALFLKEIPLRGRENVEQTASLELIERAV